MSPSRHPSKPGAKRGPAAPRRAYIMAGIGLAVVILTVVILMPVTRQWIGLEPKNPPDKNAAPGPMKDGATRPAAAKPASLFHFTDVTRETGITFRHNDGHTGKYYIIETYAAGLCVFDYNNDGNEDIYFLNGAALGGAVLDPPPQNALYRNNGDWTFTDVTAAAGVGDRGFGLGVCAGDYDNDGDTDLYINNFGTNVLYRNEGDGTFTDVTTAAGVGHDGCGAGCAFFDMDQDGDLDLYVAVYLRFSFENYRITYRQGVPMYPSPAAYDPVPDVLYRNNGDGTFTDISQQAGIAARRGWGMGVVAADYDNDGDVDIFVANDIAENFLWQNDGTGNFKEVGLESSTAYDCHGDEQGSMGVDCADFDLDGLLDFYQTSFAMQMPATFKNRGAGFFEDVTLAVQSGENQLAKVTWGCNFGDFDNDGYPDLFVAAGHLFENVHLIDTAHHYRQQNLLYRNDGTGNFLDVSDVSGPGLLVRESSRGSCLGDLDNDGDLDLVILNSRVAPTILRNETATRHHWIQILTRGVKSNRDGIGARVLVTAGGKTRIDEVHSGRGYQSHYGTRLHFGLGTNPTADRIEVRWPGKTVDVLTGVPANQRLTIVEGSHPSGENPGAK